MRLYINTCINMHARTYLQKMHSKSQARTNYIAIQRGKGVFFKRIKNIDYEKT